MKLMMHVLASLCVGEEINEELIENILSIIDECEMARYSPSSDDSRMENLAGDFDDPAALAGLEEDPQALGRMMRKMSREMGEELGPEFDEVVDRLEKGQSPEDIESALPDLGGDDAGGMGGMGGPMGGLGGLDDF